MEVLGILTFVECLAYLDFVGVLLKVRLTGEFNHFPMARGALSEILFLFSSDEVAVTNRYDSSADNSCAFLDIAKIEFERGTVKKGNSVFPKASHAIFQII